ncbi:(deoxy)nucleoside triphosphate pyrophosphohydrolase [Clostridia bacterium]|nr:(deoxy)nucleoside triphosphate pyrophosphohydrolase [Clostridia bacterium]
MKKIEVVAGIIQGNGRFLCTQRGAGGPTAYKWEFPGGKIEKGETPQEALIREIQEELDVKITIESHFLTVFHTYSGEDGFELTMHSFLCQLCGNRLQFKEHIGGKWLRASELDELDWAEADWPIVREIMHLE